MSYASWPPTKPQGSAKRWSALRDDVVAEVGERAASTDLIILGLQRGNRGRKVFGDRVLEIARITDCPLLIVSQRS